MDIFLIPVLAVLFLTFICGNPFHIILHMLWSKYEYISQYLLICHFPLNSNQHKHSQDESILINFSKSRLVFCESVYTSLFDSILLFWVLRSFIFIQNYIILFTFRVFDYCILYILGFFFSICIQPLFSFFFNVFFPSCMYLKLSCCIIFSSHYWLISHLWRALTHIT